MKTVVVTGGTRGLGIAIVEALSNDGFKVIAVARSESSEIAELIANSNNLVCFESFDFSKTEKVHEFAANIVRKHGRIYGLVNNAAVGHDGVLATMHESQISGLIKVNVEAPILLTKYLVRPMLINRDGRIVNITSIIANTGFSGLSVYGATKAALAGFTKSLSREVGKAGITVNSVAPGYMETSMTAGLKGGELNSIRRRSALCELAGVKDVAHAVVFLMGEKASMITGTTVTIDAGSTA